MHALKRALAEAAEAVARAAEGVLIDGELHLHAVGLLANAFNADVEIIGLHEVPDRVGGEPPQTIDDLETPLTVSAVLHAEALDVPAILIIRQPRWLLVVGATVDESGNLIGPTNEPSPADLEEIRRTVAAPSTARAARSSARLAEAIYRLNCGPRCG